MNLKVIQTLLPAVGSAAYLYYVYANENVSINLSIQSDWTKPVKKIFDFNLTMRSDEMAIYKKVFNEIQNRTSTIIYNDQHVIAKYGADLAISCPPKIYINVIEDLANFNKINTMATMNLTQKKSLLNSKIGDIEVGVDLIRYHLYYIFPRTHYIIRTVDIKYNENRIRKFERFQSTNEEKNGVENLKAIRRSRALKESELILNEQRQTHMSAIRDLIEDKARLKKLGAPLRLKLMSSYEDKENQMHEEIWIDGEKQSVKMDIISEQNLVKEIHFYYDIGLKLDSVSDYEHKIEASKKILNPVSTLKSTAAHLSFLNTLTENPQLLKVFKDIKSNLLKEVDAHLKRHSAIGKPYTMSIKPEKQSIKDTEGTVIIEFDGKLNRGEMIVELSRSSVNEAWTIVKSDMKTLWNVESVK